ncbi:hypothetical protein [Streptomyces formicae]
MRWLLLGILIGLLIACPPLLTFLVGVIAALLSQPLLIAFALGALIGRPVLHRLGKWAR